MSRLSIRIELALLKKIARQTGTNVTSVIHAGIAGAVQRTILEMGGDPEKHTAALYALPMRNHPGTIKNNWYDLLTQKYKTFFFDTTMSKRKF